MKRLLARIVWDIRLQFRNGFYYVAGLVVLMFVVLLAWLPEQTLAWVMPIVLFGNIATNGFYFMSGLVLLEKAEGSLEAQVVTPLRDREYLLGKVLTLSVLSLIESVLIVAFTYVGEPAWLMIGCGVVLMAAVLACFGFLTVARYDSINEFLFPSILVTTLLAIPLLDVLDVWSSPLLYLHPTHASLVLLRAGLGHVPSGELAFAFFAAVVWAAIAFALCLQGFHRFVVARQGAR
ncbi:MAG: ABC transporter permease [Gammaproteobacteria bacterium]|nr:ABC transporter permease [Gammaproteobacteria bacterium]